MVYVKLENIDKLISVTKCLKIYQTEDTTEEEPTVSEVSEPGTSDEAAPVVSQAPSPPPVRPDELPVRRLSRRKSDLFPRISAKAAARRHCTAAPSSGVVVDEVTLSKCPWDCARSRTPATFTDCFTRMEDNVHTVANSRYKLFMILLIFNTVVPKHYEHLLNNALVHFSPAKQLQLILAWMA
ncbi:uncharacterized protein TNCV_2173041 [Trichonephila clavipes]|nr:uncharacterized protein TNCV_2173041 [Trichonephila clavipes]